MTDVIEFTTKEGKTVKVDAAKFEERCGLPKKCCGNIDYGTAAVRLLKMYLEHYNDEKMVVIATIDKNSKVEAGDVLTAWDVEFLETIDDDVFTDLINLSDYVQYDNLCKKLSYKIAIDLMTQYGNTPDKLLASFKAMKATEAAASDDDNIEVGDAEETDDKDAKDV